MCSHVERTKILHAFKTSKDVNTVFLSKVCVPVFFSYILRLICFTFLFFMNVLKHILV